MTGLSAPALYVLWAAAAVVASMRWLRVAQREHYQPGRVTSITMLWVRTVPFNAVLLACGVLAGALGFLHGPAHVVGLLATLAAFLWPLGLSARPKPRALAWTPRMRRLALVYVTLLVACWLILQDPWRIQIVPLFTPILVDLALWILVPLEAKFGNRYVNEARERLRKVAPRIVAITGSYGKTSTKLYAGHLASAARTTLVSPASFNNLMGLTRAVNERLTPGTEVFIAEMGTYGEGEIDRLTEIFPPEIAAITTIGEAHLERMRSRETIFRAKSEIVSRASIVVLNVDVPELSRLADAMSEEKRVIRCSSGPSSVADVLVAESNGEWTIQIDDQLLATIPAPVSGYSSNLAIAIGICLGLNISTVVIAKRLQDLPSAEHRAAIHHAPEGYVIIDDTYNSNPVGAARALEAAQRMCSRDGRIWVVTPGMVELGSAQDRRNRDFAAAVTADPRGRILMVQRTNRKALLAGATQGRVAVSPKPEERLDLDRALVFPSRDRATRAVMGRVAAGDVLLYENDLPDHYP